MAPLNYHHQHDRQLEDGFASHGDAKIALKEQPSVTPQTPPESPQRPRKMNLRRFTVTFGLGLLVGFGLVTGSRSRPHRSLCSQEIHASTDNEMKALVEQTKDDSSALGEILRCASPETFHRLVSVYFPDRSQPNSDDSRSAAIGKDETWLLTAWEKLVKRQEDGSQNPATPTDAATDDAGETVTETTVVTEDPDPTTTSDPPPQDDPSTTESDPQPEPTTSDPPPDTNTEADEPTTVDEPTTSSTTTTEEEIPETTSEEPEEPSTTEEPVEPTSSISTEEPVETTTEASSEPSSSTTEDEPESSTSEEAPPPSTTSSSSEPVPTVPRETTTKQEDDDRPSKTTIHSTAVRETITSTNEGGGVVTITSTSWVAVDPPHETDHSEDDPSLQDAGPSLRASVGPAAVVGGLVAALLMT